MTRSTEAPSVCVLMIVPQYPFPVAGGLEKQAHELGAELVRTGHVVRVLSGRVVPGQEAFSVTDGVEVHRLPWPKGRLYRWTLLGPLVAFRMVRLMLRSDTVHAHVFSGFGLLSIALARLCARPVIVKLPNVRENGLPGLLGRRLGSLKVRVFKWADAVVAMSTESLTELRSIGYDRRRVLATPNGIRLAAQDPSVVRSTFNGCRLVFLGRLHPAKGLMGLLDALVALRDRGLGAEVALDIYGDGEQREALARRIRENGLSSRVTLQGHREDAADMLTQYDALVLPSRQEGNSNVILEAMAAGLPVVSTWVGGTPMLVGPAGERWLHEPDDVSALTGLLERLISDAAARQELGKAMRQRAEQYFDIRAVARTYVETYRKLAQGRRTDVASSSNPVVAQWPESGDSLVHVRPDCPVSFNR